MPHCLIAEMFASTKIYVLDLKKENVKHRGPAIKVHMLWGTTHTVVKFADLPAAKITLSKILCKNPAYFISQENREKDFRIF